MTRTSILKLRITAAEQEDITRRATEASLSVSAYLRSLAFPVDGQVTTADKLPVPKRKANSKLCRSCAKAGVAAWNCRQCSPHAAKAGVA